MTEELQALLKSLYEAYEEEIRSVAKEMKPCEYCATQQYEEIIVRELLNHALLDLSESEELNEVPF